MANINLSSKAGYGKNVYTGQQYVITYAGIDDRAYLNMHLRKHWQKVIFPMAIELFQQKWCLMVQSLVSL